MLTFPDNYYQGNTFITPLKCEQSFLHVDPCDAQTNPCQQVCNKVEGGDELYECSCRPGYEDVDGECVGKSMN